MRCAEEDVPRLDAAALLNLSTRLLRERPGDEQQVDADEGARTITYRMKDGKEWVDGI